MVILKEATSFFNQFVSSSKFSFATFCFSSLVFDVDKVTDLGLL